MRNSITLNFILFTCFLVIGYSVSARFYPSNFSGYLTSGAHINTQNHSTVQSMNNGQRSILLIMVDSVESSKPDLKGLWLVTYLPSDPIINILPIFPTGNEIFSENENKIGRSFKLDRSFDIKDKSISLTPSEKFVETLKMNNYWWSGYFIFDQVAMETLVDQPEVILGNDSLNEDKNILDLRNGVDDPQKSFSIQLSFLQSICNKYSQSRISDDFSKILSLMPTHIATDMDVQQLFLEWENSISGGSIMNCRFPTIQAAQSN